MIKRIIFDLDNTIMIWKDNYINALKDTLLYFKVDIKYLDDINNIIENLENKYDRISKEVLLDDINNDLELNLNIDFVDYLFKKQSLLCDISSDVRDTLKYLSSKYSLAVLTNYFKEVQEERLRCADILKYFDDVYGGELFIKPDSKAFLNATSNYKVDECLMIGDNIKIDIDGAKKLGFKVVAVDYFNKTTSDSYPVVRKFGDLRKIL